MQIPNYPKIPWYDRNTPGTPCVIFEKYDGTCLSWHWNRDHGFKDFYTRRRVFDASDPDFGQAVDLFRSQTEALESSFFRYTAASDIVVYAEYFGLKSFAGLHDSTDAKELKFFDVWTSNLGFIEPKEFVKNFSSLPLAREIYRGKLTGKVVESVKNGQYGLTEGAVCKGGTNGKIWACKIKTTAWMNKLEASFKGKTWMASDQIHREVDEELDNK